MIACHINGMAQSLCNIDKKSFIPGEQLQYQLYYNLGFVWINAGDCELSVHSSTWNDRTAYQLKAVGKTRKSFDSFFKIRDSLISYVDPFDLTPFKAIKIAHENAWKGEDDYTFKKAGSGWRITTKLKRKNVWHDPVESYTTACGFDIITSLYRLRCISDSELFNKFNRIEIQVRLDDGEYKVYLTYLGKDSVNLHGDGNYPAHAFRMTLIEGNVFKSGDVLKFWISDDKNRIPLMVESPLKVGMIKAIFRSAKNTLYPLARPDAY